MYQYSLQSGVVIQTRLPVKAELQANNVHILLLMKPGGNTPDNNIIGYDSNGNILWEVEPYLPVKDDANPYMDIQKKSEDFFIGATWKGIQVEIDVNTGKIASIANQRPW